MNNSLIIAPGYPHELLGHIRRLIKENDMSFLVDDSAMMSEYRRKYPEDANGICELGAAYRLGMISEMASIINDPMWRKRSFINKYAMILMREDGFKERQMAEIIETFMQIFDWDFQLEIIRRWTTSDEDKADFHNVNQVHMNKSSDIEQSDSAESKHMADGNKTENDKIKKKGHNLISGKGSLSDIPIANAEDILTKTVRENVLNQSMAGGIANKHTEQYVRQDSKIQDYYDIEEQFSSTSQKEFIQNEILKNGIKFEQLMSSSVKSDVKKAIKGNSDAQCRVAEFYALPNTVHTDYVIAAGWYKLSASQGNRKAQFELGMLYDSGKVKCKDYKKMAIDCYMALAESGFPTAQCTIGLKYRFGDGVEENREEAVRWLKKAAVQGHVDAQRNLGDMYLGIGNKEEARRWFSRAKALGDDYSEKQMERLG